ncbi:alpha/beta hydrolase [Elizabethkingia meningoseptica]|uniref:alpha/beta hydrolase n=1 Tax=Elizabethkingia meningoseptica TaxID=238 RepID=UPI00093676EE|nr:alpha/beta hydrolase [Elizabethkingia meningoseptica]MDE5489591.1 alpha/beta hydrolase [Elizabethkingia meningoseptica]MVW91543.1 alpha/beta hydrolase [Elizabethkingia meningoseptica]OPC30313.1 alpha/beta hydrolase [Elizabethkingia meningoseptica]
MKAVKFKNRNWDVAGILQFPKEFDETKKYPAIVCAHPISSCKEQTAGNIYGKALAEAGFITLTFDASNQGESGGEVRFLEDPAIRVEDFRCAADFLTTLSYIDEEKIGVLGICGGGGYAASAAMTERRFKAVVTVVGANYGRLLREGDFTTDAAIKTLEGIAKQRTAQARGAEPAITVYRPNSQEDRQAAGIDDIDIVEAVDYYQTPRGQHRNSPNHLRVDSLDKAMAFDAFHLADLLLTQPLHIVIGDKVGAFGSYRDGFELFRKAASKQKSIQVVQGASHYDLYDGKIATGRAIEKIIPFFKEHLG